MRSQSPVLFSLFPIMSDTDKYSRCFFLRVSGKKRSPICSSESCLWFPWQQGLESKARRGRRMRTRIISSEDIPSLEAASFFLSLSLFLSVFDSRTHLLPLDSCSWYFCFRSRRRTGSIPFIDKYPSFFFLTTIIIHHLVSVQDFLFSCPLFLLPLIPSFIRLFSCSYTHLWHEILPLVLFFSDKKILHHFHQPMYSISLLTCHVYFTCSWCKYFREIIEKGGGGGEEKMTNYCIFVSPLII